MIKPVIGKNEITASGILFKTIDHAASDTYCNAIKKIESIGGKVNIIKFANNIKNNKNLEKSDDLKKSPVKKEKNIKKKTR